MTTKLKIDINDEHLTFYMLSLYELIAKTSGEEKWNADNIRYDCTKINVSSSIYDAMEDRALSDPTLLQETRNDTKEIKTQFAMYWCMAGPKVDATLSRDAVEIFDGFILFED
jgi:hypothetical protein